MKEERSDELIEIANREWPLTYVRVAIFRCGIKGQGFKVCEFAILIIMFGGVFVSVILPPPPPHCKVTKSM